MRPYTVCVWHTILAKPVREAWGGLGLVSVIIETNAPIHQT